MATLKDLYDVYTRARFMREFYETESEFAEETMRLSKAARDAVMEEQGIDDPDKAAALPEDTVLGGKAQAALDALKAHMASQL